MTDLPIIEVRQDYDGFFEGLVTRWAKEKQSIGLPFNHSSIVITSGPWRPYAVTTDSKDGTLHIDFYSALRTGFGDLSWSDVQRIMEKL